MPGDWMSVSTRVSMITGMSETSGSALSADRTDHPSMPGIMASSVIASGRNSSARRNPSSPPSALITRKPSLPTLSVQSDCNVLRATLYFARYATVQGRPINRPSFFVRRVDRRDA